MRHLGGQNFFRFWAKLTKLRFPTAAIAQATCARAVKPATVLEIRGFFLARCFFPPHPAEIKPLFSKAVAGFTTKMRVYFCAVLFLSPTTPG
jgi:hypothetical protein